MHPHTLHSLQLSQCRVGVQSLGKRTRSLGANVVVIETGSGVGGCEHSTDTLPLLHHHSLILSIIVFSIYFYVLNQFLLLKSCVN